MAVRIMAIFAPLKLDVLVGGHNESEQALAVAPIVHRTSINGVMDAARLMLLRFLPETKICILGMDGFLESCDQHFLARFMRNLKKNSDSSISAFSPVSHRLIG
jgi:hypothetical protein